MEGRGMWQRLFEVTVIRFLVIFSRDQKILSAISANILLLPEGIIIMIYIKVQG